MTATTFNGGLESTPAAVDEGCTSNHSTIAERACYDPRRPMNWMRTATLGVVGGALVTLLARASTSVVAPTTVPSPMPSAVHDIRAAMPAIDRLHERIHSPITPISPGRNLFAFHTAAPSSPSSTAPERRSAPAATIPLPPAAPALALLGIAEEAAADGHVRTAIISGAGGLHFARVGDTVVGNYRVTDIREDAVALIGPADAPPLLLRLK